MSFTNLATKLMLNGNQINGGQPQGDGFPYLKFAWEVEISGEGLGSSPPLVAKTCELPRWSTDTQIINAYNHKTIVQTKLNYEPITISFYDQCNGIADSVVWAFVKGQFDPTDGSKAAKFTPLTIKITQKNLSGQGAPDKIYTLGNAFITDVQHDTLDYSASDVVLWTWTIRYEDLTTTGYEGPTPKVTTGIASAPKETKKPTNDPVTPPVTTPPDAKDDKPADGWKQNGGGEVTKGDKPDPYAAVTGIPRGRLGLRKLPGDVGYTSPQTQAKTPSWWPFSKSASPSTQSALFSAAPMSASASPTDSTLSVATTLAISLNDNTAKDQTFNPSTGTNTQASAPLQFNRALTSQQADYVNQQVTGANLNTNLNPEWRKAYIAELTANPPSDNSETAQRLANDNAKRIASNTASMYASQARVVDNGIIINKENTLTREPTGPAVINGYATPNANDPRSVVLSSQQATREQKYQLKNPVKGNNGY